MRPEDLIPAFVSTLEDMRLTKDERKDLNRIKRAMHADGYYDTEDCDYDLNENLFNMLNNHAAPYFYFGSHPGDGADYGFWLTDDLNQSVKDNGGLVVSSIPEASEVAKGTEVLVVNDHGNASLYYRAGNRLVEVWSVV